MALRRNKDYARTIVVEREITRPRPRWGEQNAADTRECVARRVLTVVDIQLTQAEADALLALEKHRVDATPYDYPSLGGAIRVPLTSPDKRESFVLDISRGQIDLRKGKYQNRARSVVVLARLDFGGQPHRNPDDAEIASPHLHLYREGYGDKWAYPLPAHVFRNVLDPWSTLQDFMRFINVTKPPDIRPSLFP
ncbi:MAG TPA: hypothetical protein VHB25_01220 [Gemmatimonadaceae bacterium]|nr:hypothetical protein [Gemmatimonadaceae bacterium]